jgi:ABC-type uncharacterized transport system YnjBCD permease subunit
VSPQEQEDEPDRETRKERVNREMTELLGELRVALPGVQMLFAFLLTVPFDPRFERLTTSQRKIFYLTFVCTTIASIFLIAPSSNHRLAFRAQDKERLLLRSNKFAIAGIVFLALAMGGATFLITEMILGRASAWAAVIATFTLIAATWYFIPLYRRVQAPESPENKPDHLG